MTNSMTILTNLIRNSLVQPILKVVFIHIRNENPNMLKPRSGCPTSHHNTMHSNSGSILLVVIV